MKVALVNINRIRPPIAPLGLEYVAESLVAAGHSVALLDLTWSESPESAIDDFFSRCDVGLVGISLRNTDDCAFTTKHSFLEAHGALIGRIRARTDALLVLGGAGFSVMPRAVLAQTAADAGIRGEGEFAFPLLADCLASNRPFDDVPGLIRRAPDGAWRENPIRFGDLRALPPMRRRFLDNVRYFSEGGQAAVETSRGCPMPCTFCADPVAKGRALRLRAPQAVADEIEALLAQGIDGFHTADSELNLNEAHLIAVCETIIARGLGEKVRWYAYANPVPFSKQTVRLAKKAGCAGIDFSVDHGDPDMLKRLGRTFSPADILTVAESCADAGIAVMFDLLIGSPGETFDSVSRAVELMKRSRADRIGISLGLRVWPETALARELLEPTPAIGLIGAPDPTEPLFFMASAVADDIAAHISESIAGDPRFLFFNPSDNAKNYNYNDNRVLTDAVQAGFRGAYWDILRRLDNGERV